MLEVYPPRTPGRTIGLGLIAGIIVIDVLAVILLIRLPINIWSFFLGLLLIVSIPCLVWVAFLTAGLSSSNYHVEADSLVIEWGRLRQVIGLNQIQALYLGDETIKYHRFRGSRWPGLMFGRALLPAHFLPLEDERESPAGKEQAASEEMLAILFFATRPINQQLLISTGPAVYGISPPNPAGFKNELDGLRARENNEPTSEVFPSNWSFLGWDIWHDRVLGICLGVALLLNGLLFGLLTILVNHLPAEMALHFDGQGQIDRFGSPAGLFLLPLTGLITLFAAVTLGWFYYQNRREKPLAYIVAGAAVLVELATWLALAVLLSST